MKVLAWPSIKCVVLKSTGKFSNSKDGGHHVPALKVLMNWKVIRMVEDHDSVKQAYMNMLAQ